MGYNSFCVGNITELLAPSKGFSRSRYWMTSDKFCHNWPWLPLQQNLREFSITRLRQRNLRQQN